MTESFTLFGKIPLRDAHSEPDKEYLEGVKRSLMNEASSRLSNLLSDGKSRYTEFVVREGKKQGFESCYCTELRTIVAFLRPDHVNDSTDLFYCNTLSYKNSYLTFHCLDGMDRRFELQDPERQLWRLA